MPSTSLQEFAERRRRLMNEIGTNGVAIITAAPECIRTGDSHYPYRQDSDFYYLTGFNEPEAIAVFTQKEYLLFNRKRDLAQETWTGLRTGQEGAVTHFGANQAFPIDSFFEKLPELLLGREKIYYAIGRKKEFDQQLISVIEQLQNKVRMGMVAPADFANVDPILSEMRLIKGPEEIILMRKAAQISAKAHVAAMRMCKPGLYEYQLEAKLLAEFYDQGSRAPAYNSIVGGGANGCILHYNENNAKLKDGELVLIDAGCEYQNYASDITRTFPVNGRFSAEQCAIYEIVLAAQLAAIADVKPGVSFEKIHETAVQILVEGLVKLKILSGNVKSLIEKKAYSLFYMHRTSHWLGLDTHDAGKYKENGEWRKLVPGMVLTVEPGLYLSSQIPNLDQKWHNIGVRIEDDILVTENGYEVLSKDAPKTVQEIEALVGSTL